MQDLPIHIMFFWLSRSLESIRLRYGKQLEPFCEYFSFQPNPV
jgi:hypothetical protein